MINKLRNNRNMTLTLAVAVVALVGAIGVILLSVPQASGSPYARYADIPQSRLPDGGFVLGNPDAPVTVVEFGDFACPHCQEYFDVTENFIDNFVRTGLSKFEFRMFISGADPTFGPYTAQLAECAADQREDAFWPAYDVLFQMGRAQGRFNDQVARDLAQRLDLSAVDLINCSGDATQVRTDMALGQQHNVQSTPTIMIRYNDGNLKYISDGLHSYDRGGVPYEVLQAFVMSTVHPDPAT